MNNSPAYLVSNSDKKLELGDIFSKDLRQINGIKCTFVPNILVNISIEDLTKELDEILDTINAFPAEKLKHIEKIQFIRDVHITFGATSIDHIQLKQSR